MMMKETLGNGRIRHYSSSNMMIRQVETGNLYEEAVDITPLRYSYEETETPIPGVEATVEDKAEAYDILMGVAE